MNLPSDILSYIIAQIKKQQLRYEVHTFPSGAVMVDIWIGDKFYVIQLEKDLIGLSLVNDNPGFDTIPDETFKNILHFKARFEKILHP
jgi:hypothetical protein